MTSPDVRPTIDERIDAVEGRCSEIERHYDRRWLRLIPYTFLAVGMGVALFLVSHSATSGELSAERRDRLEQDCESRVEARGVLRDVITQAYTPTFPVSPQVAAIYTLRRDALLARAPVLHCTTKTGIPIPEPADAATTTSSAGGAPIG